MKGIRTMNTSILPPTPVLCPHGRAIAWTGTAMPGERLPLIEHCPECFPFSTPLDTP